MDHMTQEEYVAFLDHIAVLREEVNKGLDAERELNEEIPRAVDRAREVARIGTLARTKLSKARQALA